MKEKYDEYTIAVKLTGDEERVRIPARHEMWKLVVQGNDISEWFLSVTLRSGFLGNRLIVWIQEHVSYILRNTDSPTLGDLTFLHIYEHKTFLSNFLIHTKEAIQNRNKSTFTS